MAEMDTETQGRPTLERLRDVWARRKWLAMLAFLPIAAAGSALVLSLPRLYQSAAIVLVDRQQLPEDLVRPTVTGGLETRLQTINQEILSRSRLEQLITRFGLYPDLRRRGPMEAAVEQMRRDIHLELRGDSHGDRRATIAFSVSYLGSDPQTVAQVTNTLASFFVEENLKVRERQATGTAEFLRVQLDQVKAKLDEHEKHVSEFKKRYVGELPQQYEVNLATLERLNAQLRLNNDSQTRALERREALTRQMADAGWVVAPAGGSGNAAPAPVSPAALRLVHLRQELAELRTRFSDRYPDVIRTRAEIAALEKQLAEAAAKPPEAEPPGPTVASPALIDPQLLRMKQAVAEAEAEVKVLKTEEKQVRQAIGEYQRRVQETPVREQQFKELARDYEATQELHGSLLKRYAESQIAESMEHRQKGEQFRVIEPALAADDPVAPNRLRLLAAVLAVAAGAAMGLVLFVEQLDTTFHTVDEVRDFTRLPVLVSIPAISTEGDRRRQRRMRQLATVSALAGLVLIVGAAWWLAHGNESLVSMLAGRKL